MITKIYMNGLRFTYLNETVTGWFFLFIEIAVGIIIYTQDLFYKRVENQESIIYQETDDITLLEVSEDTVDKANILKYLNNNIRNIDDTFFEDIFKNPVKIKFKYRGKTCRMCLTKLESTHGDHTEIEETPRILSASINDVDFTDIIEEYHGNTKNFYRHIPDTMHDISYLINEVGELHVYDTMGDYKVLKTI